MSETDARRALLLGFLALNFLGALFVAVLIAGFPETLKRVPGPEMASIEELFVWVGLGLLNIALALLVLTARPRRSVHRLLVIWFVANGIAVPLAHYFENVHAMGLRPIPQMLESITFIPLVLVPLVYPRHLLAPHHERWLLRVLVFLLIAMWWASVLSLPPLTEPSTSPSVGNVVGAVVATASVVGMLLGCVLFLRVHLNGPTASERAQALPFLAAYLITAATAAVLGNPVTLSVGPNPVSGLSGSPVEVLFSIQSLARIILATFAVAFVLFNLALSGLARARYPLRPVGGDALLFGVAALGLGHVFLPVSSQFVWMFVRPLLFTYGILRLQLLEVQVSRQVPLLVLAILSGLMVAHLSTDRMLRDLGAGVSLAAGVATVASLALGAVFAWPVITRTGRHTALQGARREREAYRAALEQSMLTKPGPEGHDTLLRALRGRLGVSEREHALMELELRAAQAGNPGHLHDVRFLGKYRVERLLGEGSFARTFLATDERLHRQVVLKAILAGAGRDDERALQEARILARLDHPNLVKIHDMEEIGEELVLVLEYVPGGSLAAAMREGPLDRARALSLTDDVLKGLEAAHKEGIIHRDLKPDNVLLTESGRAKLADFGVARDERTGTLSASVAEVAPGTVRYMSPEQASGASLNEKSDLYSAGVLLYEMLTGRNPSQVEGLPEFEARLAIVQGQPDLPVSGLGKGLNAWLRRALARDPERRFSSASAMCAALRKARQ